MDNEMLAELLTDSRKHQFWIKPWGDPDRSADERESFGDPDIRILFAKHPTGVDIGDILFVHRIKAAKLTCVTEAMTPARQLTDNELLREPNLERWRWRIDGKNLSPKFGWWWRECSLKTFTLATEYNELNPNDHVNLGSLNHGNDKLKISQEFARFLLGRIIAID